MYAESQLTDEEIRQAVREAKDKGQLLEMAAVTGVAAIQLQRILDGKAPIDLNHRFMLCAVLGE